MQLFTICFSLYLLKTDRLVDVYAGAGLKHVGGGGDRGTVTETEVIWGTHKI